MIKTMAAYNAAKAALEVEKNAELQSTYAIASLVNDMLQYRRENNIFEAKDKIIFGVIGNSVMQYDDCLEMFLSQGLIRHATDEEIKAGYKL